MDETPEIFLKKIRSRRGEIHDLRQSLDAEDEELKIAERVAERLTGALRPFNSGATASPSVKKHKSQTELVISTLTASAEPWFENPVALHDEIRRIHKIDIKRVSLMPILSNLKSKEIVMRKGPKVALAARVINGTAAEESGE